jgi:hypothetical protein
VLLIVGKSREPQAARPPSSGVLLVDPSVICHFP